MPIQVRVTTCENCKNHDFYTRHKPGQYQSKFNELRVYLEKEIPGLIVSKVSLPKPPIGSFELEVFDVVFYSKIKSSLWPNLQKIAEMLRAMIKDHEQNKSLDKYRVIKKQKEGISSIKVFREGHPLVSRKIMQKPTFQKKEKKRRQTPQKGVQRDLVISEVNVHFAYGIECEGYTLSATGVLKVELGQLQLKSLKQGFCKCRKEMKVFEQKRILFQVFSLPENSLIGSGEVSENEMIESSGMAPVTLTHRGQLVANLIVKYRDPVNEDQQEDYNDQQFQRADDLIQRKEESIKELIIANQRLGKQLQECKKQLKQSEASRKSQEAKFKSLKTKLNQEQAAHDSLIMELNQKIQSQKAKLEDLKERVKQTDIQAKQLGEKVRSKEQINKQLKVNLAEAKKQRQEAEKDFKKENQLVEKLNLTKQQYAAKLQQLKRKVGQATEQCAAGEQGLQSFRQQVDRVRQELRSAEQQRAKERASHKARMTE